MTALWIVGILLAIFLVVQLSRVGVRLAFGEECRVMLRLGPIRMQVVPKKETAKKKPKKDKATKKKKENPKRRCRRSRPGRCWIACRSYGGF